MLVSVGKGIELDVDVTRFNTEVMDHIVKTGLRNLIMDSHASATQKADPTGYIAKSRELAERKLASLYSGVVRTQAIGGLNVQICMLQTNAGPILEGEADGAA
jgi:hypothetical protein